MNEQATSTTNAVDIVWRALAFEGKPYGGGTSKEGLFCNGVEVLPGCLKGDARKLALLYNAAPEMLALLEQLASDDPAQLRGVQAALLLAKVRA